MNPMKTSILPRQVSALFAGACLFAGAFAAVGQAQVVPTPTFAWENDGTASFTSATSFVSYDTGVTNPLNAETKETFSLWMQNPGTTGRAVILGIGNNNHDGSRTLQLWSTYSDGQYTLNLGYSNWNAGRQLFSSDPITIAEDTWYNLAFVIEKAPNADGDTRRFAFTVYLTSEDETALNTTPIFSGVVGIGYETTGPANGPSGASLAYVGASPAGFYSEFKPAGWFGGDIDQVAFWQAEALTTAELNDYFQATVGSLVPEPSAAALLAGAGVLGLAFARRRRREHA